MNPLIIITRPSEDAAETAALVERLGFRVFCAPALQVHDVESAVPDAIQVQGLIFSSANGVRAFIRRDLAFTYLDRPVFAVGDHTAAVAGQSGFTDVRSAGESGGTMRDLVALIRRQVAPPARLLHLRGRDVRDNPAIMLSRSEGWNVEGVTVYVADPVENIALPDGLVAAVLFYSARSATAFIKAAKGADFRGAKALCLADSVLESLDRSQWGDIRVAPKPDQSGMMSLVEALGPKKPMQINQTANDDNGDHNALTNAEAVIERFGGIRPMATKMNVPVTTVQGWKKRSVIPGNRRNDVVVAAKRHNINLAGLIEGEQVTAPTPESVATFSGTLNAARRAEVNNPTIEKIHREAITGSPVSHEDVMKEIKKSETITIRKSVLASTALLTVIVIFAGLLVAIGQQKFHRNDERIAALEAQAPEPPKGPGVFSSLMTELRTRIGLVETSVDGLKQQAQAFVGPADVTSITQRLALIEQKIQNATGASPDLSGMLGKLQNPEQLQATITDLQGLVGGLQGRLDEMDTALAKEQESNTALGQALEGVSPKELKAAAMLIGLTQFRQSMNRSEPFADDLALMQKMNGTDDPEMNAAIAKLAPYAEKGVLSPEGLADQLKGLTGDIVVASVSGQDVSIKEKALARFQSVVSIQKDGQPVVGTDSQSTVARAQKLLDEGRVDEAVTELQTLQGPARQTAEPVINQAQITMMAQKVQGMLSSSILSQIKGAAHPIPLTTQSGAGGVPLTTTQQPKMGQ